MVVTKKNLLMASVGIAMAFNFSACKKDKLSQTDKLVGDWKLISVHEESDPTDVYIIEDEYLITFEFKEDQSFQYCTEELENGFNFCYSGNWEWANDDETEIDVIMTSLSGYSESFIFGIDELSEDKLEGDFNLVGTDDDTKLRLEKID